MPHVSGDGKELLYVRFSSFGFHPYKLPLSEAEVAVAGNAEVTLGPDEQKMLTPESFQEIEGESYFPWPRPVRAFPSFIWEAEQFKAGIALQTSDYLQKHSFTGLALFGNDQDYQVSYENRIFYPTLSATYTAYIRNNTFGRSDLDPDIQGVSRDNIQFVNTGVSQDFKTTSFIRGTHQIELSYNRRTVDRRFGVPFFLNNQLETSFRLITNNGMSAEWTYRKRPARPKKDFDINPREYTFASAQYSLVHTSLLTPDTSISTPNKNYFYHEGTFALAKYFKMPWTKPWWKHHTYWFRFNGGYKSRDVTSNDEFFLGGRISFRAFGQVSANTLFYGYEDFQHLRGITSVILHWIHIPTS